jgi:hypothetical protein
VQQDWHRAVLAPHDDEELVLRADPFAQLKLLDLQQIDSSLDQMAHRLQTMPERLALQKATEQRADLSGRHGQLQTEVADLVREQRKAEADVEQVRSRSARNRERIEGGLVSDAKQLQAMQHELETLAHRISDLEDAELEVMERLEEAESQQAGLSAQLAKVDDEIAELTLRRDAIVDDITARRAELNAERVVVSAEIPADLLALYERLRTQLGGVGVGALHHKRCGGCQLNVGAADLARMAVAPSDEVLRCEECDRILVRTADSGL